MGKFLLPLLLFGLVGCLETKHLRNLPTDKPTPQEGNEKLEPEDFVFSKVSDEVFSKECVGCHGDIREEGNVNLQTYENAVRKLTYLKSVVETGEMGFETLPTLTERQKALVLGWIDAGAPK